MSNIENTPQDIDLTDTELDAIAGGGDGTPLYPGAPEGDVSDGLVDGFYAPNGFDG
jgi:hypothetical protein